MAQRQATRRYPDTLGFLRDWRDQLSMSAMLFPPGALDDPAPELKVDLVLPGGARVGPIVVQLINTFADGSTAFRVVDLPKTVQDAGAAAEAEKDRWQAYLLSTGELSVVKRGGAKSGATDSATDSATGAAGPAGARAAAEAATLRDRVLRLEAEVRHARALATSSGGSGAPTNDTYRERGLPVPDVGDEPPWASGKLGDLSLRTVFMRLSVEKPTGLLTLSMPDGRTRWVFIQKGGPVGFRSDPLDEQEVLGVLLYKAGSLTKEQLAESLALMETRGIRQGDALIELGVFTFAQLVLVLQKQCEFVMVRMFAEKTGTWTFHALDDLPERFIAPPLRVAAHLFRVLRTRSKTIPADEMAGFLRPRLEQYIYIKAGVERTLEEMRLTADEQAFLKILGSTSFRLRELPSVSNMSRGQTGSMIWCLTELGLIEFRAEGTTARSDEKIAGMLHSRKQTLEKGSYFDQLECHWMGTSADVEKAWRMFNIEFPADNPGKYGAKHEPDVRRIIEGVRKAYDVLSNEAKRREYRATKIERVMVEQSAMMLAGKGDMAIMKDAIAEAYDCFSKAAELMPNVGEYRLGLERAKAGRR